MADSAEKPKQPSQEAKPTIPGDIAGATVPPKPSSVVASVDFVVQISDAKNRNVMWPPSKRQLRGQWAWDNLRGVTVDDRFQRMPDLPGMVIAVRGRNGYIVDPLNNVKNKAILDEAQAVCQAAFATKFGPEEDVVVGAMTDDELKNWCYWVRRFLDNRQVTVLRGQVPSMAEIDKFPGKLFRDAFDHGPNAKHDKPLGRYVPPRFKDQEAKVSMDVLGVV